MGAANPWRGQTVKVIRPVTRGVDSHGNAITVDNTETVERVLVNRPTTANVNASSNASTADASLTQATSAQWVLAFPKTYQKSLRNCRIVIPKISTDIEWYVIGNPMPIPADACPTRWNYLVEVCHADA